MADLSVTVGADVSAFNKAMSDVGTSANVASSNVSKSLSDAAMNTDKLGGSAQSASMKFYTMRSGISAARDGVMAFTLSGQSADRSLMAMGHHITSLVNETGSFKGAMQALGSSLLGAGGIILAITLAAELWDKYSKAQKKAEGTGDDFLSTLNSTDQALLKGAQTGQQEVVRLGVLYDATQNHTLSLRDRNRAYDELASKYPAFFTNAEREKTLLGENSSAYDKLRDAILAAAMAKAAEDQIGVNSNRQLENSKKLTIERTNQIKLLKEQKTAEANAGSNKSGGDIAAGFTEIFDQSKLDASDKRIRDITEDTRLLVEQNKHLYDIAKANEKAAGFKTDPGSTDGTKKAKEAKTYLQLLEEQLKKLQSQEDEWIAKGNTFEWWNPTKTEHAIMQVQALIDKAKEANLLIDKTDMPHSGGYAIGQDGKIKNTTPITEQPLDLGDPAKIQAMAKAYIQLSQEQAAASVQNKTWLQAMKDDDKTVSKLTSTLGQGLMSAFEQAISGSKNFLQAFGQFILQLIEKILAAAAAALILAVLLSLTGISEFSAGFGTAFGQLSGLGGLVSGKGTTALPTHASGGIFTQAHAGIFGEAGPEAIVTPQHLADFAGIAGQNQNMQMEPFQIGATMWFRQNQRVAKYINRTK